MHCTNLATAFTVSCRREMAIIRHPCLHGCPFRKNISARAWQINIPYVFPLFTFSPSSVGTNRILSAIPCIAIGVRTLCKQDPNLELEPLLKLLL